MKNARKERFRKRNLIEFEMSCHHKIKYAGKKQALEGMIAEMKKRCVQLYVYKCTYCRYWHLTSSARRNK